MRRGGDQGVGAYSVIPLAAPSFLCVFTPLPPVFFFFILPPKPSLFYAFGVALTGTSHVHARVNVHSGLSPRAHWGLTGRASALSDSTRLSAGEEDEGGSGELRGERPAKPL